ncbi:MAG TPA: nucleotidyl transferase AbiEii/AbiGii toxin family protein [Polyangiaceae bacterium]|nr:nucleotidyl transferase AbiEii/AbiGii toxin family protein [Polyangiaceae bacterium]
MNLSPRQVVEAFHLILLRALLAKGESKKLFALKGGCNLRFFFGSTRYSEDMDIDVDTVAKGTLKNKVDKLLQSPLVLGPLKAQGIEVNEVSSPKQTETTQRWKVGLRAPNLAVSLRTKVEFSRREALGDVALDAVGIELLRPYAMSPFLAAHYSASRAVVQKIHALAGRTEPQARDVFDLNVLFARKETASLTLSREEKRWIPNAIENSLSISFDDYVSQVVSFLDPAQRDLFAEQGAWDTMQRSVLERIDALR